MSTTLTWASSGNIATSTGNGTLINFLTDLNTLITAQSANAAFFWQVAGAVLTGTQPYLVLSRKSGVAGRIVVWGTSAAFSNFNPTVLDTLPTANVPFIMWFPQGTGSTISNLNATSGTICGNDTGAVKCSGIASTGSSYGSTNIKMFYFDCQEAVRISMSDPSSVSGYELASGLLTEDGSGTAYDSTAGTGNVGLGTFTSNCFAYQNPSNTGPVNQPAGIANNVVRVNYTPIAATETHFYQAFVPAAWANQVHSSTDCVMADDSNNKVWFGPVQLIPAVKGTGAVLKFRQYGYGPCTSNAFASYSTTGPVLQAIQMCNLTLGQPSQGMPWLTNFKI